jgi:hypothetical protein
MGKSHGNHHQSFILIYPLVMTNIAMGNGPFIDGLLIKMVIFHGYVKYPDGIFFVFLEENSSAEW